MNKYIDKYINRIVYVHLKRESCIDGILRSYNDSYIFIEGPYQDTEGCVINPINFMDIKRINVTSMWGGPREDDEDHNAPCATDNKQKTLDDFTTVKKLASEYPSFSEGSIRSFIFRAPEIGFDKCIRRIGRKILISRSAFANFIENYQYRRMV